MQKSLMLVAFFMLSLVATTNAQVENKNIPAKLNLVSLLGNLKDSSTLSPDVAGQYIAAPLVVTDAKKNSYTISSYTFIYKKVGVTEDEATGKVSPTSSMVANVFKVVPLTPIWVKTIQEQATPGEQLIFTDIIVKDAKGKLHYAPTYTLFIR